ncbi:MAG TPA: hydroxyphenylacetyl-CoA thioesterase PaaI [Burkholderiaceae bacterium]|nr:hydroxyphenylacetyl-CoA thioesterase PaaI [Burkholderiaceae bacterium]
MADQAHVSLACGLPEDPQALATLAGKSMYERDAASQALGASLDEISPGKATMSMTVRADMLNGHKTCHGGFIFALADSTFAFACNSHNLTTVASGCTIDFLAPAFEGDRLTARAVEYSLAGRTGIYDVHVSNQHGKPVAVFRGRSYRIKGNVVEAQPAVEEDTARPPET